MRLKSFKTSAHIILIIVLVLSFSMVSLASEDTTQIKVSNGYGYVGKIGKVQKGTIISANLKTKVSCITTEQLMSVIRNHKNEFTNAQFRYIEEESKKQHAADLFAWILGIKYGDNNGNHFKNCYNKEAIVDNSSNSLINSLSDLINQNYELKGRITAKGKSYIATTAYAFVKMTIINFENGHSIRVVSTDAIVADKDGKRGNVGEIDYNKEEPDLILSPIN